MKGDSPQELSAISPKILSGQEAFHRNGNPMDIALSAFWGWAYSNLAANNLRGHLAEFLVASDLGLDHKPRVEWDESDLRLPDGTRLEIKSAAYLQSWKQNELSKISFSISPTCAWDAKTQKRSQSSKRHSDAYVFCLLKHIDKPTLDPLNVDQWEFYIVATQTIDSQLGSQKTLSLKALERLQPVICGYGQIGAAIKTKLDKKTVVAHAGPEALQPPEGR